LRESSSAFKAKMEYPDTFVLDYPSIWFNVGICKKPRLQVCQIHEGHPFLFHKLKIYERSFRYSLAV